MAETEIMTHVVDPEAPEARPYILLVLVGTTLTPVSGMDAADPRTIARRVADFKKRYAEAGRPTWVEPLLEGDADGEGYVVLHDPTIIVGVSTPTPPLDFEEDIDPEEDPEAEEPEAEEEPTPKKFKLPSKR